MSEPADEARAPALVWARQRPAPRRSAPDVARIVAHAVAVADTEGLAAVSMRRIATDLGSGTASLYRYVTNRDELLDLMIDAVRGEDEPPPPTGSWRADLTAIARRHRGGLLRHPWLTAELTGRPTLGPNSLRSMDAALAAAAQLTDDIGLAGQVVGTVQAYVFGAVTAEIAEDAAQRRTGRTRAQWQAEVAPYLATVVASGELPRFARWVSEAAHSTADQRFEAGLGCVLDGVAAAQRRRRREAAGGPRRDGR